MNDHNIVSNELDPAANEETTVEATPPVEVVSPGIPPDEIENGKAFAILSYAISFIGLPFFVVPLITRDNDFALYHAKQSLMLWLAGIALGVVSGILTFVCIGPVIGLVGMFVLLVFNGLGLVIAIKGEVKPLPWIGIFAIDWFKGITKIRKA